MAPKILTVDDSKTIRSIVARAFKNFACEIFEAADGVEGLAVAQRERPDIIILDLTMPVMDGAEMLIKLKTYPELRAIPVVMLTAEAGKANVLRIAKLGVRDYLLKPFKEELIVERVGRIIDLKAKNEANARAKRFDDPLQVLVVEDKSAIIEQLKAALADTPWKVQGASHMGQAVDFCTGSLPDIALVSLSLPENTAFVLFEMLRAGAKTRRLPVLALSVKTSVDEQTAAQQAGFNGLITKPIEPEDVKAKISRALCLDTSYKYFQRREDLLVLALPAEFSPSVANEISAQLRSNVHEAVDAGLNRLVLDMSQPKAALVEVIKLALKVVQLCEELQIRHSMVGCEAVNKECLNYEETKNWHLANSFDEALAELKDKVETAA